MTCKPYTDLTFTLHSLDQVVIKDINTKELDIATGELARKPATTSSKIYRDFLKSILTTKVHLNAALKRMPYITQVNIKNVVIPMIQVTGLCCIVYVMNVINKKVYSLQRLCTFYYPSTEREVKNGAIKTLLDGFASVEVNETSYTCFNYFRGRMFNFSFFFFSFYIDSVRLW